MKRLAVLLFFCCVLNGMDNSINEVVNFTRLFNQLTKQLEIQFNIDNWDKVQEWKMHFVADPARYGKEIDVLYTQEAPKVKPLFMQAKTKTSDIESKKLEALWCVYCKEAAEEYKRSLEIESTAYRHVHDIQVLAKPPKKKFFESFIYKITN